MILCLEKNLEQSCLFTALRCRLVSHSDPVAIGGNSHILQDTSVNECVYRSEWPRGLRHELSSLARKLRSWVRIPLKTWMSVWVYCVCVVLCVGSGLVTVWSPVLGVLPSVYRLRNPRAVKVHEGCRAIDRFFRAWRLYIRNWTE
jgi:hypothetical protein